MGLNVRSAPGSDTEFFLEKDGNEVVLKCIDRNGEEWDVLVLTEDGVVFFESVGSAVDFKRTKSGAIAVVR